MARAEQYLANSRHLINTCLTYCKINTIAYIIYGIECGMFQLGFGGEHNFMSNSDKISFATFSNSKCSRACAPKTEGPWEGQIQRIMLIIATTN